MNLALRVGKNYVMMKWRRVGVSAIHNVRRPGCAGPHPSLRVTWSLAQLSFVGGKLIDTSHCSSILVDDQKTLAYVVQAIDQRCPIQYSETGGKVARKSTGPKIQTQRRRVWTERSKRPKFAHACRLQSAKYSPDQNVWTVWEPRPSNPTSEKSTGNSHPLLIDRGAAE